MVRWLLFQVMLHEYASDDFNVHVIKDSLQSFSKTMRYGKKHCASIGAMTESNAANRSQWRNIPLTLSYALTIHKCQGMTMPVSFPSLSQIFGFGMPYTLLTRTPFSDCMLFIGVPPKDIFEHILSYDPQKLNYLDRKRAEINGILTDPTALSRIVNEKVASGEFDLETIGKALLAADADVTQYSKESLEALAHTHMCERLRTWYTDWRDRLHVERGFKSMVRVSHGFSEESGSVKPWKNRPSWPTLAEALQGGDLERRRIQFYKKVATQWMTAKGVNVMSMCSLNEGCFPLRSKDDSGRSSIHSYNMNGVTCPRPMFPVPPAGFQWGSGKQNKQSAPSMTRPEQMQGIAADGHTITSPTIDLSEPASTTTAIPIAQTAGAKRKSSHLENVASQIDARRVKVHRVDKKILSSLMRSIQVKRLEQQAPPQKQPQVLSKRQRLHTAAPRPEPRKPSQELQPNDGTDSVENDRPHATALGASLIVHSHVHAQDYVDIHIEREAGRPIGTIQIPRGSSIAVAVALIAQKCGAKPDDPSFVIRDKLIGGYETGHIWRGIEWPRDDEDTLIHESRSVVATVCLRRGGG